MINVSRKSEWDFLIHSTRHRVIFVVDSVDNVDFSKLLIFHDTLSSIRTPYVFQCRVT